MHANWVRDQKRLVAEAAVSVAETGHLVDAAVLPVLDSGSVYETFHRWQ